MLGMANCAQNVVGLGSFWPDLKILESFVVSHEV